MNVDELRMVLKDNNKPVYIPDDATKVEIGCSYCGVLSSHEDWAIDSVVITCPKCDKSHNLHYMPQTASMDYALVFNVLDGTIDEEKNAASEKALYMRTVDSNIGTFYGNYYFNMWSPYESRVLDVMKEHAQEMKDALSGRFDTKDEIAWVESQLDFWKNYNPGVLEHSPELVSKMEERLEYLKNGGEFLKLEAPDEAVLE